MFDGPAQGMAHDPFALRAGVNAPAFRNLNQRAEVVFANVVQVVGDRAAHIQCCIVLQQFEQFKYRSRISLKRGQAHRPGQTRARAFRHQAAHVVAGVMGPFVQLRQRGLGVMD